MQTILNNYFTAYWPWLIGFLLGNTVLFVYSDKLHKKAISFEQYPSVFSSRLVSRRDCIWVLITATIFIIWKTAWLGKEDVDMMESGVYVVSWWCTLHTFVLNAHQPLYHFLLKGLMYLFATGGQVLSEDLIWIFRFVSVLFGGFVTVLLYRFSFLVFKNKPIAYVSIILINIWGLFSYYCRRIESYTVFSFFALLCYYFFWTTFVTAQEKRIGKYCIAIIFCFFIHYLTLLILLSHIMTVLVLKLSKHSFLSSGFWRFIKALTVFNFILIPCAPFMYLSLFKNSFVFAQKWENAFYLEKEYFFLIVCNVMRFVLGLPSSFVLSVPIFCFIFFIFLKLRKENSPFFVLLATTGFFSVAYGAMMLFSMWRMPGRLYFNVRHFVWIVPLMALVYSYGVTFLKEERHLYKKILACISLALLFLLNFNLTGEIVHDNSTPDYKKAVRYIDENIESRDYVVFLNSWISCPLGFYFEMIEPRRTASEKYKARNPAQLLECRRLCDRIWFIVPWENILGVPHLSEKTLKAYVRFAKDNFTLRSHWQGNQIEVYLFACGDGNDG